MLYVRLVQKRVGDHVHAVDLHVGVSLQGSVLLVSIGVLEEDLLLVVDKGHVCEHSQCADCGLERCLPCGKVEGFVCDDRHNYLVNEGLQSCVCESGYHVAEDAHI